MVQFGFTVISRSTAHDFFKCFRKIAAAGKSCVPCNGGHGTVMSGYHGKTAENPEPDQIIHRTAVENPLKQTGTFAAAQLAGCCDILKRVFLRIGFIKVGHGGLDADNIFFLLTG